MTNSQRIRALKAQAVLTIFFLGTLLHVLLTVAFHDTRSTREAQLDLPAASTPSSITNPKAGKQPSLTRLGRTTTNKDCFDDQRPSFKKAISDIRPGLRYERVYGAASIARASHRPRDPPFA